MGLKIKSLLKHSIVLFILISGCSGSARFTSENDTNNRTKDNSADESYEANAIRVLMDNPAEYFSWGVEEPVFLFVDGKKSAVVNEGNNFRFTADGNEVNLIINDKNFNGKSISFTSKESSTGIKFKGKNYRGAIKIIAFNNQLTIVNSLSLEDYLKGVLPLEMPVGKNNENFEALKAFAICARTYSFNKLNENKNTFDVFIDTRDQVYGGKNSEKEISNKAVNETRGEILTYKGGPAITFYSASCGGHTENVRNVFTFVKAGAPYLEGVVDGEEPYCSITPRFEWEEKYSEEVFIQRLKNAGLINNTGYNISDVEVASRFESGRVNELKITLGSNDSDDKVVSVFGNNIRSVIRTGDDRGILRSAMFEINKNSDGEITINGKGYGHGVGLCQWGTIYLSHEGWNFKNILDHYFPGTSIEQITL